MKGIIVRKYFPFIFLFAMTARIGLAYFSATKTTTGNELKRSTFLKLNKIREEKRSNFCNEITRRMIHYNVYPSESSKLQCIIVTNHSKSLLNTISIILDNTIPISNITSCYNPRAQKADMPVTAKDDSVYTTWQQGKEIITENSKNFKTMETLIKEIINY